LLIYIDIWRAWIPVNPQVPGSSPGRGAIVLLHGSKYTLALILPYFLHFNMLKI